MKYEVSMLRDEPKANWVAKITGADPQYKFKRQFVNGTPSHSGNRLTMTWELTDGLYEVALKFSAKDVRRFFILIENGAKTELNAQQAEAALAPMLAASTAELVTELGLTEEQAIQKARETGKRVAFACQTVHTEQAIGHRAAERIESDITDVYRVAQPDGKITEILDHHY